MRADDNKLTPSWLTSESLEEAGETQTLREREREKRGPHDATRDQCMHALVLMVTFVSGGRRLRTEYDILRRLNAWGAYLTLAEWDDAHMCVDTVWSLHSDWEWTKFHLVAFQVSLL